MATTVETLAGKEGGKKIIYETRGWLPDGYPPYFLTRLSFDIKNTFLNVDQEWSIAFIKAAIVDLDGIRQNIDSYLTDGPSENSPTSLVLGFQFTSSKAPLQLGLGRHKIIAVRRIVRPFFSGKVVKRETNDYILQLDRKFNNLVAKSYQDAIRDRLPFFLGGMRLTDSANMNLPQEHTINELAGFPHGKYQAYVHMTLCDTYRAIRDQEKRIAEDKKGIVGVLTGFDGWLQKL